MSAHSIFRLSGLALMVGAIVSLVASVVQSLAFSANSPLPYAHSPGYLTLNLVSLVAALVLFLGLPGTYAVQAGRAGMLGLAGTAVLFCAGILPGTFFPLTEMIFIPYLADKAPDVLKDPNGPQGFFILFIAFTVLLVVGFVLLAIPMLRRQAWSRGLGIAFLVAAVLNIAAFIVQGPSNGNGPIATAAGTISTAGIFLALAWWGWFAWKAEPAETASASHSQAMPAGAEGRA
jgi:hypothetical protein